ncbi:MAG: ABC transporter substrate-binding protein [Nitrospinae bacterium]|nr:ABC transporter substrate-binding protein [Nitrospinota bacterium]
MSRTVDAGALYRSASYVLGLIGGLLATLAPAWQVEGATRGPITIGLIAPLSGGLDASGEAIQRGMLLALDELNRDGGVLGRPLALLARDVPNDPQAGVVALRELLEQHAIVAVFGGIFSPVMLAPQLRLRK